MKQRALFAVAATIALSACVAGPAPEIATPTPKLPATFYAAPADVEGEVAALLPKDDPAFLPLATQALGKSPSLGEALARIDAARARVEGAGAARLPEVGANASVTGSRTNPQQFGAAGSMFAIDSERASFAANLTASWDPDIFGRLRARERAAIERVDSATASAQAVRIALIAEIAGSVIDWRTLDAREAALREDLAAAEQLAQLADVRARAGISPGFDQVRAESTADGSRSRLLALESERAQILGRLVTLTAQDAASVEAALGRVDRAGSLPDAPAALPSSLLQNRPDVLAAGAELRASDADLAAAARARFPTFNLSGVLGLLSFGLGNLFDADSVVGSLGASVAAPLLDFGRIQAEIDGAAADKRAAFQAYRGAVYRALGEAESGYGLIAATDREATAAQSEAQNLRRAADLAVTRYRAGLSDFLTALEARRAADASSERAAAALGRARRARTALWQALGGSPL